MSRYSLRSRSVKSTSTKTPKRSKSRKGTLKKSASEEKYYLADDVPFVIPKGLIRVSGRPFLMWKQHPWLTKLQLSKDKGLKAESAEILGDKSGTIRKSVRARAQQLMKYEDDKKDIGSRTRGWSLLQPAGNRARVALALVRPESFLVYEIQKVPKTWTSSGLRVIPKFPIGRRLPSNIEEQVWKDPTHVRISQDVHKAYGGLVVRGLRAAHIRAAQHQKKFGPSLLKLIEQLETKVESKEGV